MTVTIRPENPNDLEAIAEVNRLAFGQEAEAILVDLLRKSDAFVPELSLVAIADDKVIGHILFSEVVIVDANQNEFPSLALAPMAVLPAFQRKGIGGQLVKAGLEKAKALKYKSVIVLGHEHYYPKFGFEPAERWGIRPPFEVPANVFMAIELVPGGLKGVSGTVRYPKEFSEV